MGYFYFLTLLFMKFKHFKLTLVILILLLNISCVNTKVVNGQLPDANVLSALKIGKDKKGFVKKMLGSPSFNGDLGDNSLYYVFTVKQKFAFLDPKVIDHKVLQLKFSKDNTLKNINLYKQNDLENVVMSQNFTVTSGRKISLLEQLISNIGVPGMGRGGPIIGSGRASD
tara:strand:+ start:1479 stop:1988 length:510 start_codon:yes stop_codon:yes gene_type:complete